MKLLAPHLTPENHVALLDEARGQTRRNVEEIVARVAPKPDAPAMVRKLPAARWTSTAGPTSKSIKTPTAGGRTSVERSNVASTPALPTQCCTELFSPQGGGDAPLGAVHASEPQPSAPDVNAANSSPAAIFCPAAIRPAVVVPIAPERYKVQVTVDAATHATLRRLQDLLRHEIPDGDPATIIARALALLLEQVGRRKYAATRGRVTKEKTAHASQLKLGSERVDPMIPDKTDKQRSKRTRTTHARRSRYIPAAVRRTVWLRDEGRCTFVGTDGRCPETAMLEYHHAIPFADRGEATASNLRLTCRRHNKLEADRFFGTADPCEGP